MKPTRILPLAVCALLLVHARPAGADHVHPFSVPRPFPIPPVDTPTHAEGSIGVRLRSIPAAETIEIDLPDATSVVISRVGFARRGESDYTWYGRAAGGGDAILTVKGHAVAGVITTRNGAYVIRPEAAGDHRIFLVDETRLPAEIGVPHADLSAGSSADATPPTSAAGQTLDVLIVYTQQARDAAGGTSGIEASIQNAVDWANTAYANSGVAARQRLVRTQMISYADSGNMDSDLSWLRSQIGSSTSEVGSIRNAYGADLVALVVNSGQYCGIAYVMANVSSSFANYAASVTARSCLPSTHAHEVGHNQGCMHDPDNASSEGAYDFSFGHRYCFSGGFRTVMAYSCTGATRVPHFSNPDVYYDGGAGLLATGQWAPDCSTPFGACRDCAATIDLTAPTVAAFRSSVSAVCGDGSVNQASEQCDGNDFAGKSCTSLGFDAGALACRSDCTISTSGCSVCGDNVRGAGEACDGTDLGSATCASLNCTGGAPSCASDCTLDASTCTGCAVCDHDGTCETEENCTGCASDCQGGAGAACGNGVCETVAGEDCLSCPSDCRGQQGGKPANRYCCGDGAGVGPRGCGDPVCTQGSWHCTSVPTAPYCCGDGQCTSIEDGYACALDCGAPPYCGDGLCSNGETACTCPTDCGGPGACTCSPAGATCTSAAQCCSGTCKGAAGAKTCR
jgi:hypothetical protein